MSVNPDQITVHSLTTAAGAVDLTVSDQGTGHPFLLLHGGAGPQSVQAFAEMLVDRRHARVLTPTHPGFGATVRPEHLASIRGLAGTYVALLDELDLYDVTVVGNSIGGWVAAEIAILASPRVSSVVLVDAVGLELATHPIVDFFSLSMVEITERSYFAPAGHGVDVDGLSAAGKAVMAGNRGALLTYGGTTMADPTLRGRLGTIDIPALVVWGAADRIVDPEHGRVSADSIPGARLEMIESAGHLPQVETPEPLTDLVWAFADQHATQRPSQ